VDEPSLDKAGTELRLAEIDGASAASTPPPEPRVVLHTTVDVRSVSLVILATLASIFMLRWASAVFIPIMLGLMLSYALSPIVGWLHRRRIPRAISAALLLLGIMGGLGSTAYALSDDAANWLNCCLRPRKSYAIPFRPCPPIQQHADHSTKGSG
jgi:hypothetical protein